MTFYTGDSFPEWKGNLLIAGLSSKAIVRLTLEGDKVTGEERLAMGRRIRDVVQGPDGAVYALVDDYKGKILRLTPTSPRS
jgi:glucose/arabinose dehydrogenase